MIRERETQASAVISITDAAIDWEKVFNPGGMIIRKVATYIDGVKRNCPL